VSVVKLCTKVGMTRANYYKRKHQSKKREINEGLVISLVNRERRDHPRIGGRKLYKMLKPELEPTSPNQIWVSDITYVRLESSFVYLSLITDLHSRKIVGHYCSDSLESLGCVEALDRALADLPADRYPIHHSDRGCQYCCHEYIDRLIARGLPVSMTEDNHCYENATAERVNGILKQEYGLHMTFRNIEQARRAIAQAVCMYNNRRPHMSLQYRTPAEVHAQVA